MSNRRQLWWYLRRATTDIEATMGIQVITDVDTGVIDRVWCGSYCAAIIGA
jgi:hypothetical protein